MAIGEKEKVGWQLGFRKSFWFSHGKPSYYTFETVPPMKWRCCLRGKPIVFACHSCLFSTPFVPFIDPPPGTPGNRGHTDEPVSGAGCFLSAILLSPDHFTPLPAPWLSSGVCSVSQPAIDCLLNHGTGNLVGIVVGGVGEALRSVPNTTTLILQKHKASSMGRYPSLGMGGWSLSSMTWQAMPR